MGRIAVLRARFPDADERFVWFILVVSERNMLTLVSSPSALRRHKETGTHSHWQAKPTRGVCVARGQIVLYGGEVSGVVWRNFRVCVVGGQGNAGTEDTQSPQETGC